MDCLDTNKLLKGRFYAFWNDYNQKDESLEIQRNNLKHYVN